VLFSSLIMLVVPAMAAGVAPEDIAVVSPPPTRRLGQAGDAPRDISPITLAVASMLGLSKVYRVGGPPAVAALAHGTESIAKVNLIAGPGHPVVQAAKLAVAPAVAVDGYYGTSEVVVIADGSADPACVAADLLAQAEHDPGRCFLVTWDRELLGRVVDQMQQQLPGLPRRPAIERALAEASAALLVRDLDEAIEVADRLASEHVSLAVDDPSAVAACLSHGGELFLGRDAPVAAGDYYAGPSHTLPTGTTARFSSGVSVYTFLKRTGTVAYPGGLPPQAADDIAAMAQAEGLEAHAASVRVR
jgi:histidinol dehydrogenase